MLILSTIWHVFTTNSMKAEFIQNLITDDRYYTNIQHYLTTIHDISFILAC